MSTFRPRQRSTKDRIYDLIPPEPNRPMLRPLNRAARPDVEDADFTVVTEPARERARPQPGATGPGRPFNDNATVRPKKSTFFQTAAPAAKSRAAQGVMAGESLLSGLSVNLFSALVAMIFLLVFGLAGGLSAIAMMRTGTTSRTPVDITHVAVLPKTVDGQRLLQISGIIENHARPALDNPRLRADFYSGDRLVATTLFGTRTGVIETGESAGFQVKLPQAGGKTLDVRLFVAE